MKVNDNKTKIINANFRIDKTLWKQFIAQVKREDTDASKKLRKFIKVYLNFN